MISVLPSWQAVSLPCRKSTRGNGPDDRSVGWWTVARSSTGAARSGGVNAVSPKSYSSVVTASGPGAPGSGAAPARTAHESATRASSGRRLFIAPLAWRRGRGPAGTELTAIGEAAVAPLDDDEI